MPIHQESEAQRLNFIRKHHSGRAEILGQVAATIWVEYVEVQGLYPELMEAPLEGAPVEEISYQDKGKAKCKARALILLVELVLQVELLAVAQLEELWQ